MKAVSFQTTAPAKWQNRITTVSQAQVQKSEDVADVDEDAVNVDDGEKEGHAPSKNNVFVKKQQISLRLRTQMPRSSLLNKKSLLHKIKPRS